MKIKAISKHTGETTELRIQDMWDAMLWFNHNINLVKPDDNFNPMGSHKNFTFEVIPEIICPSCETEYDIEEYKEEQWEGITLFKCRKCKCEFQIKEMKYFQTEEVLNEKD